jgi:hypothetical protein
VKLAVEVHCWRSHVQVLFASQYCVKDIDEMVAMRVVMNRLMVENGGRDQEILTLYGYCSYYVGQSWLIFCVEVFPRPGEVLTYAVLER